MPDRPRDPRMPRATYRDPRNGTAAPSAVVIATAVAIAWAVAGATAAGVTFGAAVVLAIAWYVLRKK